MDKNPPLFIDDLKLYDIYDKSPDASIQTVPVFSNNSGTELGFGKYVTLCIKRRNIVAAKGMQLADGEIMWSFILKRKKNLKESMYEGEKNPKTRLNRENIIKGIKTWSISLLRLSASLLD